METDSAADPANVCSSLMSLQCNFSTSNRCNANGANNGVIIIPVILGFSSVVLIIIIIWKTCKMKKQRDRAPVILLQDNANAREILEYLDFVKFHMKVCNHDSIVKLLGCRTERLPLYIFLEYVSGGCLLHSLWQLRETAARSGEVVLNLTEQSMYSIAKQVACGLDYLTTKHKVIHGDIAARNILIHEDLTVKLTGLSLAFDVYKTGTLSSHKAAQVPIKWLAPERIIKRPITEKSDTWSFGILLYEVVTLGAPPYPDFQPLEIFPKLQRNYRMPKPFNSSNALYDLMKQCWQWKPYERPNWADLTNKLEALMNNADGVKLLQVADDLDLNQYKQAAGVF
ncbi:tyrosine-protein kinase STYK1 isoform X3 [Rhincodon typus]|uniref:tyrosine-protein kinase STYK1 isoform X3 n=1 Tax=Rhincodon typus TaxID=259920 RepID=UPI00202EBABD|nr:tyrosine-protein kinase STYK1 isoform X3 [Rhincodon typus]